MTELSFLDRETLHFISQSRNKDQLLAAAREADAMLDGGQFLEELPKFIQKNISLYGQDAERVLFAVIDQTKKLFDDKGERLRSKLKREARFGKKVKTSKKIEDVEIMEAK